jgi:metal-responsive CopG/Arc/MetJ family transcriptional regulator
MKSGRACNTRTVPRPSMMQYEVPSQNSSGCKKDVGRITGAVLVLYYPDKPGLLDEITRAQHQFKNAISSSMLVHLEENKCLGIIAVEGSVKEVRSLAQVLMARRGVKQVKVAAIAP